MNQTATLPDDPRLPGLMAIRDRGLARAIPALGLEQGGEGVALELCGYHPGARATLEARVGRRRFAVKAFADDPAPEAALYQALGAGALAEALARTEPRDDGSVGLVHGTLYARHILDVGDGPGVIDWHRFGQGPVELDAGMFLATLCRLRLLHPVHAGEALLAEQAFVEGTRGLVDEGALAWHQAAALLQLTERLPAGRGDWRARAHLLLAEATRLIERAAPREPIAPRRRAASWFKAPALELVLQALSARPATPEELDQIRALLRESHDRAS